MFARSYAVTVLRSYDKVVASAIKEVEAATGAVGEVVAAGGGQKSTL